MANRTRTNSSKILDAFLEKFEQNELNGLATAETYSQQLAVYLVRYELEDAKFLWKRIPDEIKTCTPELQNIWNIGKKMWLKDYAGIYAGLHQDWSDVVRPLMVMLEERLREHLFDLVQNAYTSIHVSKFSLFMGMTIQEALEVAQKHNWTYDDDTKTLMPQKDKGDSQRSKMVLKCDTQLGILTDYVSFLEH